MPEHSPAWIASSRLDEAFALARSQHAGQSRKTAHPDTVGIPYVGHLMSVAALVIEHGGTEDQAIAGLLHDVVEDTDTSLDSLTARFGEDVGAMVHACSDHHGDGPKRPWRERKAGYLAHLNTMGADNPALLVALADKVHNASSTAAELRGLSATERHEYWTKFNGGEDDQRMWYRGLADIFHDKAPGRPWEALAGRFTAIVAEMFPD